MAAIHRLLAQRSFNVQRRGLSAEMIMKYTMKVYKNSPDYHAFLNEWQLSSVDKPREKITMNRWQMDLDGLLQQVEGKS